MGRHLEWSFKHPSLIARNKEEGHLEVRVSGRGLKPTPIETLQFSQGLGLLKRRRRVGQDRGTNRSVLHWARLTCHDGQS